MAIETGKKKKQQRVVLPIILWLVPLLAINLGFIFLAEIDLYWREIEQSDFANQEIEGIAAASDFSYQFSNVCGNFGNTIKTAIEGDYPLNNLPNLLQTRSNKIFRKPFPKRDLFFFKIPDGDERAKMIFRDGREPHSIRVYCKIFEYLIALNTNKSMPDYESRQNEKLLTKIFGGETKGTYLANSQRAITSYAIFMNAPNWFYWDYFSLPGKGTFGFIVLSECSDQNRFDGMLMSLRNFRDRRIGLAAFIPLFKDYGSSVLQAPLHKSRIFKNWVNSQVVPVENNLKQWLASGAPPVTELGNFKVFSFLGKGSTHLTTLLLPKLRKNQAPNWLKFLNYIVVSLIILLLLRGFLRDKWPGIKLKLKFQITFLLAATLPLSLLVIASSGYISHFRRSIIFKTSADLLIKIKTFDTRKAQIEEEYSTAFTSLLKNEEFARRLQEEGPFSKNAEAIIKQTFEKRKLPLPLRCYAILDESAQGLRDYSSGNKEQVDAFFDSFSFPIVQFMRDQIASSLPGTKLKDYQPREEQVLGAGAYKSYSSRPLSDDLGKRRSQAVVRAIGKEVVTQMHDYISINGVERFAIIIAWKDSALDQHTIKQTSDFLALSNPDYSFIHFKTSASGLKAEPEPGRHISFEARSAAKKLAETVYFKGSYSSSQIAKNTLVAYPSQKYSDTIIVGISNNSSLQTEIFYRILLLSCIVAIAVLVVIFIAYLIAKVTLDPVAKLKESLDEISSGNLDTRIHIEGEDELSQLAEEFSEMTKGLRERKRLASLLSDQAIEALSRYQEVDGLLSGENFSGVALVSDIRNFTGMCEKYSADEITELLNTHFARMATVISKQGGRIYKFIGDAIVALFPEEPNCDTSTEARAFSAAMQMIFEQDKINRERSENNLFNYSSGVGLASGDFFSGGTGSTDTRLDYAVLGSSLELAAEYENESKRNLAYPVVFDHKIAEIIKAQGATITRIEEIDAYTVVEIPNNYFTESDTDELPANGTSENLQALTLVAGKNNLLHKSWLSAIGMILISVVLFGTYLGLGFRKKTIREFEKANLEQENLRLIEQLKSGSAAKAGFENVCYDSIQSIQSHFSPEPQANEVQQLKKLLETEKNKIKEKKLQMKRIAAFYFVPNQKFKDPDTSLQPCFNKGWNNQQMEILKSLSFYKYCFDSGQNQETNMNSLGDQISDLFGEMVDFEKINNDNFAQAFVANTDTAKEFVYINYLVARPAKNLGPKRANDKVLQKQIGQPGKDFRVLAMVVFTADDYSRSVSPQLFLNSYADKKFALALKAEKSEAFTYSMNFPEILKKDFENESLSSINDKVAVNSGNLRLNGEQYKITVVSPFKREFASKNLVIFLHLLAAMVAFGLLLKIIAGKTFINRSLQAKLWSAFVVCTIIPVLTVAFVVELYSIENFNVRFFQEKAELQRFLDLFEHRQTFSEPLAWKLVKNISYSKKLREIVETIDSQDENERDFSQLDLLFSDFQQQSIELRKTVTNFMPRDAVVVSKTGWEFLFEGGKLNLSDPRKNEKSLENSEQQSKTGFAFVLGKIAQNLVRRLRKEKPDESINVSSLKGEIAVKLGIQIVSSMFGESVGIKLANGVGLPVKMGLFESFSGLIIYPVEQFSMPDYIVIWTIQFSNSNYLGQIAKMFSGKYSVFSAPAKRYGQSQSVFSENYDFGLPEINSWVSSSNLPVKGIYNIGGKDCLVESRRGIRHFDILLTGIKSLKPVSQSVQTTKNGFLQNLLLSLLLIALLAGNISGEILEPVKKLTQGMKEIRQENFSYRIGLYRKDELGDLCMSFDLMAKGLEEKLLIGKMLSKSAMKSTLSETASKKEEVIVFYVGSPGFSSWLKLSSPSELFSDLQKQISDIARIIIDEGGEIDKIIGEKILAIFKGEPQQAAVAACNAAKRILKEEERGVLPFPVSGGVNSGLVISGILGVGDKKDFTVIGDAVNVAARIESQAEILRYHRILISEEVVKELKGEIGTREYATVELKGKASSSRVFQLDA